MTLATALNDIYAEAGTCGGRLFLTNGDGEEFTEVYEHNDDVYSVSQTNAGPDLRLNKGTLTLFSSDQKGKVHTATYNQTTTRWHEPTKVLTVQYTALAHLTVLADTTEEEARQKLNNNKYELLKAPQQDLVSWDSVEFN